MGPDTVPSGSDRFLRVEHLANDVERRAARGGAMMIAGQALRLLLQIGSTAVLARLLSPRDYGVFGMAAVLSGFALLINDLGLNTATVQRRDITHNQVSALFWVNLGFSGACTVLTAALAPLMALIFKEPALTWLVIALAPSLLVSGGSAQHGALLTRQMRFRAIALLDLGSFAAGIAAAVLAARLGAGAWALVAMYLTQPVVRSLAIVSLVPWSPSWPRRDPELRALLRFGGDVTAFRVLAYLSQNADNALVGWYSGAVQLGLYSRGFALFMSPLSNMLPAVRQVVEPALSRVQDERERYQQLYARFEELLSWLTMPLAAVALFAAAPLVRLALGPGWEGVVPVLQLLSIAAPIQPILSTVGWLFTSSGNTRQMLRWGAISAFCHCAAFLIAMPFGAVGMALAAGAARLISAPIGIKMAGSAVGLNFSRLVASVSVPLLTNLAGGLVSMLVLRQASVTSPALQLAVVVACVGTASLTVLLSTGRLQALRELVKRRPAPPAAVAGTPVAPR